MVADAPAVSEAGTGSWSWQLAPLIVSVTVMPVTVTLFGLPMLIVPLTCHPESVLVGVAVTVYVAVAWPVVGSAMMRASLVRALSTTPVSYTHLDVYKRQYVHV